ncbi:hypothetical protein TIFTF001_011492 [Ficus carica]|uniref:Uncharacterized protein n=1 Tax=Ficus carica TaxID=3494 RepID=A0AA88AE73_FICCA|nr:hypothetical protein TIFTF001_011492 [Ficus carica]
MKRRGVREGRWVLREEPRGVVSELAMAAEMVWRSEGSSSSWCGGEKEVGGGEYQGVVVVAEEEREIEGFVRRERETEWVDVGRSSSFLSVTPKIFDKIFTSLIVTGGLWTAVPR